MYQGLRIVDVSPRWFGDVFKVVVSILGKFNHNLGGFSVELIVESSESVRKRELKNVDVMCTREREG